MSYQIFLNSSGTREGVKKVNPDGSTVAVFDNCEGTPEWTAYLAWLDAGNTPEPAPEPPAPPVLTTEQKLEAAGLTVAELKELFNLP
jgi:hypothetical protein